MCFADNLIHVQFLVGKSLVSLTSLTLSSLVEQNEFICVCLCV